jgi:hypothetical protein
MAQRLEPVRQTIEVAAAPAEAFRVWTEAIGQWWPLATHSVGRKDTITCALEGQGGGRIYETTRAGEEHLWGTITLWDPPHRLAHSWHPGRAPDDLTTIELTFGPITAGQTRLELVHDGWPAGAAGRRADYDLGWAALLRDQYAPYVRAVAANR